MYSRHKDIFGTANEKIISKLFEASLYSIVRFALLVFCICYLVYVLILSSMLFETKSTVCPKRKISSLPIDPIAYRLRNSQSIEKMATHYLKRKRRDEPSEPSDSNSSNTSGDIEARRMPYVAKMKDHSLKYILIWTNSNQEPFNKMMKGRKVFKKNKCKYTNCVVTDDVNHFHRVIRFDVILFGTPEVTTLKEIEFPRKRLHSQRYVFVSTKPAVTNRLCDKKFDSFFNLTWTYKLDSDITTGIIVRNIHNQIVGPDYKIPWILKSHMNHYNDIGYQEKESAAAWWPTKCVLNSTTDILGKNLQKALRARHQVLDIYGDCGTIKASAANFNEALERKYYFYLAFEDEISPDYVSSTLLNGMIHSVVPIVYGGADYTRFLPPGSYIDATKMTVPQLAAEMDAIVKNITRYKEFFKWRNYYVFQHTNETPDTNEFCKLCEILNTQNHTKTKSNFTTWWNYPKC